MDVVLTVPSLFDRARLQPGEPGLVDRSEALSWSDVEDRRRPHVERIVGARPPPRVQTGRTRRQLQRDAARLRGGGTGRGRHDPRQLPPHHGRSASTSSTMARRRRSGRPASSLLGRPRRRPAADSSCWRTWRTRVVGRPASKRASNRRQPGDLRTTTDLIYTSGTTGRPKAVEFPNQITPTVDDRLDSMARHHMAGLGPHLVVGPLYHAGPHGAVGLLLTGSPVVVTGRFDADLILDAIAGHGIATSVMVPTHLIRLLGLPEQPTPRGRRVVTPDDLRDGQRLPDHGQAGHDRLVRPDHSSRPTARARVES